MKCNMVLRNVVIGIFLSSTLTLCGCATSTSDLKEMVSNGNATSTTNLKLKPINASQVKIYDSRLKNYKVIGRISADNYNVIGIEHSQESLIAQLKKEAASIGANGVIHINTGMTQTTAEAILVKK